VGGARRIDVDVSISVARMTTDGPATPPPVRLSLRYDLRAPSFGPPAEELYAAALEQCAWADEHGFASVGLSEHHGADDGYCPSPVQLAGVILGRTRTLRVMVSALLMPLYDPIRLAEDLAVLDLASGGRIDVVVGAGYRAEEMAMFGHTMDDRVPRLEEGIAVLRAAWTGEPFEYRGRTVRVMPRPARQRGPALLLAGSTPGAARRAARIADGFVPVDRSLWPVYAAACRDLGRDPGQQPPDPGPRFIHVAEDPDRAWRRIAPHALHETNSYGAWASDADGMRSYEMSDDADALRARGDYAVMTPDECLAMVQASGALRLHPLMGGLPPDLAWESLELIATKVLPRAAGAP
jgi:alkanesulfonate monooxygenase SsuD/methylene tetrahydromethanopterin reductase-like flavin-dependent oxidoreductase (luciferase family)